MRAGHVERRIEIKRDPAERLEIPAFWIGRAGEGSCQVRLANSIDFKSRPEKSALEVLNSEVAEFGL